MSFGDRPCSLQLSLLIFPFRVDSVSNIIEYGRLFRPIWPNFISGLGLFWVYRWKIWSSRTVGACAFACFSLISYSCLEPLQLVSSVPLATKYKTSERIRKKPCTGQRRDALWVLDGCIWTKTEIWSFFTGWEKITLDSNTSWAPSDKNLPLWFSDSSLLEFCVTPQSQDRLERLWVKTWF